MKRTDAAWRLFGLLCLIPVWHPSSAVAEVSSSQPLSRSSDSTEHFLNPGGSATPVDATENIHTDAESLVRPDLKHAGVIIANNATIIDLPGLLSVNYIEAKNAKSVNLPLLLAAGNIDAGHVAAIDWPQLQTAKQINAKEAKTLNLPLLRYSEDIRADNATRFDAPLLEVSGIIRAPHAETLHRPLTMVDNSISSYWLERLAYNSQTTLNVTNFDLSRLPQDVKARLYSEAAEFRAPNLRTSSDILAPQAKVFDAPKLEVAGEIDADKSMDFRIPVLRLSRRLHTSTEHFSAPNLVHVFGTNSGDPPFSSRGLPREGGAWDPDSSHWNEEAWLYVGGAKSVDVPKLETVGEISASSAEKVDIPRLRAAGNIDLGPGAFYAPELETVGRIIGFQTKSFEAPKLREAGAIQLHTENLHLPELQRTSGAIFLDNARNIDLPKLESCRADKDQFTPPQSGPCLHVMALPSSNVHAPRLPVEDIRIDNINEPPPGIAR